MAPSWARVMMGMDAGGLMPTAADGGEGAEDAEDGQQPVTEWKECCLSRQEVECLSRQRTQWQWIRPSRTRGPTCLKHNVLQ